ncbi:MAG: protease modulator HflC [Rickettsiales bacterium]
MSKNIKRYLIILTVLAIILQGSLFTVDQRQQVLILQFGEPIRVINTPGIKFKLPFIQNNIFFEKRIIDLSLPEQEVIASDQKRLIINAYTKFQITDPLKFYTTVGSSFGLSNKLSGILDSSLRQVIGEVNLNELLTENRGDIMKKIKEAVGNSSKIFGINIIDVRIMRADLPKENSDAIYARMQTEREKEAREIRAKGAEEADKIRAEANKQRTIIIAEAKKNADIVRGNGESQANKIYASSLGKDPEFADFYRSMSAYKVALGNNNTKMIISQDNNFFKYFNNSKN